MKVKLGDVCTSASSALMQKDVIGRNGIYPIYGAAGYIGNVDFYHQDKTYIAVVKDGAGIGRTMLLPAKSSVIGTMQYLIPNEKVIPEYLYYVVQHMHLEKYFSGATIPHIYFKEYKKENFNLSPIEEQKRIVTILSKVEFVISQRKHEIKKLDELIKARFVEMFGDPVKNPFGLPLKKLSELGTLDRGRSKHRPRNAPELLNGPYPLIQTGEVAAADLYITEYHNTYSEIGLKQSKMWKAGTLCITIAANIAQTAIMSFDACFPDSVVGFVPGNRMSALYLHYWFGFFQKILEEQAPQVAQKNINLKILSDLKVVVPVREQLKAFETFVTQIDKSKVVV